MAGFAGTWNRVERPQQTAVLRVVRLDAAARAAIASGKTNDDHACPERSRGAVGLDVQRSGRDREILLPALRLNRPRDLAGRAIERHEPGIELPDEHLVVTDGDALVVPPAADGRNVRIEIRGVLPEDLAGVDRQREHIVGAGAHVRDAVVHDGLGETGVLRRGAGPAQACAPHTFELTDVGAVDRRQRGEALVVQVAAVGRPARGGGAVSFAAEKSCGLPCFTCASPDVASSAAAAADDTAAEKNTRMLFECKRIDARRHHDDVLFAVGGHVGHRRRMSL